MYSGMPDEVVLMEQCSSLVLKILRSVLLMQKATKLREDELCPELSVFFKEQQCDGSHGSYCSEIEVNYQTPKPSTFDIRTFLNTVSVKMGLVKLLQMQANGPCITVAHAVESIIRVYSICYCDDTTEWRMSWREVEKNEETHEKFFLLVTVEVNTVCNMEVVQSSVLSFLKKSQVLRPHLSVVCMFGGRTFHRAGVPGLQTGSSWKANFAQYLRLTVPNSPFLDVKLIHKALTSSPQSSETVDLLFARVPNPQPGAGHHVHLFFYDQQGVPLLERIDPQLWDTQVHIPVPRDLTLTKAEQPCPSVADVCYVLDLRDAPPECFMLVLVFGGDCNVAALLTRHGLAVGYAIREALMALVKHGKNEDDDRRWCHQVASCIGEFVRFSLNERFRHDCFSVLKASSAADFEQRLEGHLWNWCADGTSPAPASEHHPPPQAQKRRRGGEPSRSESAAPVPMVCACEPSSSGAPNPPLVCMPAPGRQSAPEGVLSRHMSPTHIDTIDNERDDEDSFSEDRKRAKIFKEWDSLQKPLTQHLRSY